MKIALVVAVVLVLALLVAARIPKTAAYMQDVPLLADVVEWIGDRGPTDVELEFDHAPSQTELTLARDLVALNVAPQKVAIRGDKLVVTGNDPFEVMQLKLHRPPLRVFKVVYESPEIEALRRSLLRDDQANHLGLSVKLDHVGYYVTSPDDVLDVNETYATKHHCTGHHIEGTGTACYLTTKERFDAYVRGDPDLFVDAHPLALPAGRDFYATDKGPIYELESAPLQVPPSRMEFRHDAALIPLPEQPAADIELVVETQPGTLVVGEVRGNQLAIPPDLDLELASFGLRVR